MFYLKDIDYRLIDINKWEETLDQIKDKKNCCIWCW